LDLFHNDFHRRLKMNELPAAKIKGLFPRFLKGAYLTKREHAFAPPD